MTSCVTCAPERTENLENTEATYRPAADVIELEGAYRIEVELPGVKKENVDLDLKEDALTVRATVEPRPMEGTVRLRGYGIGNFERTFRLGKKVNREGIRAELAHGLLTLHLPKTVAAQPRKIEIV
ncbi:MAG: Hsp20/alpha crystallin family protein [bacterium]